MLCIGLASGVVVWAVSQFTLEWTHSVEKFRWSEEWQVTPEALTLISAEVAGSGAGVDLPPDAIRTDQGWRFTPRLSPQPKLSLAASGMTVSGWQLCGGGECLELGKDADDHLSLWPCAG